MANSAIDGGSAPLGAQVAECGAAQRDQLAQPLEGGEHRRRDEVGSSNVSFPPHFSFARLVPRSVDVIFER